MEKNTIVVGAALLLVGLGLGYVFGGNLVGSRAAGSHRMGDGSTMRQNIDQHFIAQMIPHHEGAIAMAKIALERSKRPEVLSLAQGIIEAQERENKDMRAWYKAWFGSVPSAGASGIMGHGGMMHMDSMTGDMAELSAMTTSEFDREFLEQMIPHHEMAIMMAQMLAAATERTEMKQLADAIITSQSREIEMMRSWLVAWSKEE